ncbi:hypothetical protein HYQ46_009660 [Verticillium longisporum]|nr:hypothetical protein HYQ46_009660 [Verticillium longisporum]
MERRDRILEAILSRLGLLSLDWQLSVDHARARAPRLENSRGRLSDVSHLVDPLPLPSLLQSIRYQKFSHLL